MSDSSIPQKPPFEESKSYQDDLEQFVYDLFFTCSQSKHDIEKIRAGEGEASHRDIERWTINELTRRIDEHKARQQRKREEYDRGEL